MEFHSLKRKPREIGLKKTGNNLQETKEEEKSNYLDRESQDPLSSNVDNILVERIGPMVGPIY